jgi:hypothetical protein
MDTKDSSSAKDYVRNYKLSCWLPQNDGLYTLALTLT